MRYRINKIDIEYDIELTKSTEHLKCQIKILALFEEKYIPRSFFPFQKHHWTLIKNLIFIIYIYFNLDTNIFISYLFLAVH